MKQCIVLDMTTIKNMKLKCKLGWHKKKLIGTAIYPYDTSKLILAFGCKDCEKKLKQGLLVNKNEYEKNI